MNEAQEEKPEKEYTRLAKLRLTYDDLAKLLELPEGVRVVAVEAIRFPVVNVVLEGNGCPLNFRGDEISQVRLEYTKSFGIPGYEQRTKIK